MDCLERETRPTRRHNALTSRKTAEIPTTSVRTDRTKGRNCSAFKDNGPANLSRHTCEKMARKVVVRNELCERCRRKGRGSRRAEDGPRLVELHFEWCRCEYL